MNDQEWRDEVTRSCARTEQAVKDLARHTKEIADLQRAATEREVRALHRRVNEVRTDSRWLARRQGAGTGSVLGALFGALAAYLKTWGH